MKLPSFYFRRFTRIWIPWFAIFVLSWIAMKSFPRSFSTIPSTTDYAHQFWTGSFTLIELLKQLYFGLHGESRLLLPQDWSLGVELKASAVLPLFILIFRKFSWAILLVGLAFIPAIPSGYYYLTFTAGVLMAGYSVKITAFIRRCQPWQKTVFMAVGLALFGVRFWNQDWYVWDRLLWSVATIGCVIILATCMGSDRLQAVLSRPLLVFFGRISYSVYLTQFLVLLCAVPPVIYMLNSLGLTSATACYFISILVGIGLTIGFSMLTYRWIEVPAMDLGRAGSKRLDQIRPGNFQK